MTGTNSQLLEWPNKLDNFSLARRLDTQYNDIQHNDIQCIDTQNNDVQ